MPHCSGMDNVVNNNDKNITYKVFQLTTQSHLHPTRNNLKGKLNLNPKLNLHNQNYFRFIPSSRTPIIVEVEDEVQKDLVRPSPASSLEPLAVLASAQRAHPQTKIKCVQPSRYRRPTIED